MASKEADATVRAIPARSQAADDMLEEQDRLCLSGHCAAAGDTETFPSAASEQDALTLRMGGPKKQVLAHSSWGAAEPSASVRQPQKEKWELDESLQLCKRVS